MAELQGGSSGGSLVGLCPSGNDGVTKERAICPVCGRGFQSGGRRRFCSDGCRQAAWRARHPSPKEPVPPPKDGPRTTRWATVYECPSCSSRYLGEQRCPECGLFCRRVGPGGRCPHCDEPVALSDLPADGWR